MRKLTDVERYNRLVIAQAENSNIRFTNPDKRYRNARDKKNERLIREILDFWPKLMGKYVKVLPQPSNGYQKPLYIKIDGIILPKDNKVIYNPIYGYKAPVGSMLHGTTVMSIDNSNFNTKFIGGCANWVTFIEITEDEWYNEFAKVCTKKVESTLYNCLTNMQKHIYGPEMTEFKKSGQYAVYTARIRKLEDEIGKLRSMQFKLESKFANKWAKQKGNKFMVEEVERQIAKNKFTECEVIELRAAVAKPDKKSK